MGPFRARPHTNKVHQDGPHHLGSDGVQLAVPSLPIGAQTSSYMLPVECSAPEVLDGQLCSRDIKAEFESPERILTKSRFDIVYGGW